MIKWLKSWLPWAMTDEENATYHALIALGYWRRCKDHKTQRYQIERTKIYVELGRDE